MSLIQKLEFSANVTIVGMIAVLIAVIILIVSVRKLSDIQGRAAAPAGGAQAPQIAPVIAPAPVTAAPAAPAGKPVEPGDALATVAAITAVILGSEGSGKTMTVRSIRRVA